MRRGVNEFAAGPIELHNNEVGSCRPESAAKLVAAGRHNHCRLFLGQLRQRYCERHFECDGPLGAGDVVASERSNQSKTSQRHDHVAKSWLADNYEIDADRHDHAAHPVAASGGDQHRSFAFGEIEQEGYEVGIVVGLLF